MDTQAIETLPEIEETPFEGLLEELLFEAIIDLIRSELYKLIEIPQEGFDSHTGWWDFCDASVNFSTQVLTFMIDHGSKLPDVTDEKIGYVVDKLQDFATSMIGVMDSERGWIDPFDDNDLEIFTNNMQEKINDIV